MKPWSHIRREIRGDSTGESSDVKVLTRAGQARWRAVALSEHCIFERTSSVVLDCRGHPWLSSSWELSEDNTGKYTGNGAERFLSSAPRTTCFFSENIHWGWETVSRTRPGPNCAPASKPPNRASRSFPFGINPTANT